MCGHSAKCNPIRLAPCDQLGPAQDVEVPHIVSLDGGIAECPNLQHGSSRRDTGLSRLTHGTRRASIPAMEHGVFSNSGFIQTGPPPSSAATPRTLIVSGIGRSGTSMIAAILAGLGVLSRDRSYDVTLEDREFLHLLITRDLPGLAAAIAARNQTSPVWGFKIPSIHGYLEAEQLRLFRNPHLLIVMRDPVGIGLRHAISEHMDPTLSFLDAARGQYDLACFLEAAACPTLLVSYEKGIRHPYRLVLTLARFCAISINQDKQAALAQSIRPESEEYNRAATRRFEGRIDGVFNGMLTGWCREIGESRPLSVELLVDGEVACGITANQHRIDLEAAGMNGGCHGFQIDITTLGILPEAILTVRISGRTFELPGSRQPVRLLLR